MEVRTDNITLVLAVFSAIINYLFSIISESVYSMLVNSFRKYKKLSQICVYNFPRTFEKKKKPPTFSAMEAILVYDACKHTFCTFREVRFD